MDVDKWDNSGDDDDDIIVNEVSDDEDSKNNQAAAVVELLVKMIEPIMAILRGTSNESPLKSSFNEGRVMPLGRTKLRACELLQSIISLKKSNVIVAVGESSAMETMLALIEKHPWNNMVQLKCHQIFEDVINSDCSAAEKLAFLNSSNCTRMLINMAETPSVKFGSGNSIRNGFMGFVIKLANLLVKSKDNFKDLAVESATFYSPEWTSFIDAELATSNERNSRSLGGKPTSTNSDDDDQTQHFDVNMDNIMKRFKCFTTIM